MQIKWNIMQVYKATGNFSLCILENTENNGFW